MKKTIFFDFDGPIADSFDAAFAVASKISPTLTEEKYRQRFMHNIFEATDAAPEPKDESIDYDAEYAVNIGQLGIAPAKKDAIAKLSDHYEFHVISGSLSSTITEYLERHGVHHYFTDILGSDVSRSKVDRFEMLFKKYDLNPADVVFITDTIGDLNEAAKVGIGTTIAVCDGFQSRELLESAHPTYVVDSLVDVPALLIDKAH